MIYCDQPASSVLLYTQSTGDSQVTIMSVLPFKKGGGPKDPADREVPTKVNVIVIYAGFGDATLIEVITDKG